MSTDNVNWPPAWLPDWKDASWYSALHVDGLAWQFLRRNKDYIADWLSYLSAPEFNDEGGKTGKYSGRAFAPWDPMTCYGCNPPALEGETLEQYEKRMEAAGVDYKVENLETWLCRKWGIFLLSDPEEPDADIDPIESYPMPDSARNALVIEESYEGHLAQIIDRNVRLQDTFPMLSCISVHGEPGSDENGRFVPIWFDLKGNLKLQLSEALKILQDGREEVFGSKAKAGRNKSSADKVLIEALRIFDAQQCGANAREIAEKLFDEIHGDENIAKTIARRYQTAQEYIGGAYRRLLKPTE